MVPSESYSYGVEVLDDLKTTSSTSTRKPMNLYSPVSTKFMPTLSILNIFGVAALLGEYVSVVPDAIDEDICPEKDPFTASVTGNALDGIPSTINVTSNVSAASAVKGIIVKQRTMVNISAKERFTTFLKRSTPFLLAGRLATANRPAC